MALYRVQTGSTGPGGQISDVFSGTEHIKDPNDPRLKGVDINALPLGQAPTNFTSQFEPVKLDAKENVPTTALEKPITRADLDLMLSENQKNFQTQLDTQNKANQDLLTQTLAKMQLTPEEKASQSRLLGLQQLQQGAIEGVQDRAFEGGMVRSDLEREIQNITTGNTKESLVNLRQQTFEAQRLNLLQSQRQQELEALKLQLDQGNINTDNLFKYQQLNQDQQNAYLDRVQQLTENARGMLGTILDRFQGLTLDSLSPENLAQITQLAQQAGIPIDILRDGMKTVADQIKAEQDLKRYQAETSRINANTSSDNVKLSPGQQGDIVDAQTLMGLANQTLNLGSKLDWDGVGGLGQGTIKQFLAKNFGAGSSEEQDLRNYIGNIQGTVAKLRGGTSFTPNEQKLLETYTPTINDSPLVIESKLMSLRQFLQTKISNTYQVAGGSAPTTGQTVQMKGPAGTFNVPADKVEIFTKNGYTQI